MKARDLTNVRFGNLVGITQDGTNKYGHYYWKLKCDCGNEHRCLGSSLVSGYTTRCTECTKKRWLDQNHTRAILIGDLTSAWWSAHVVKRANGYNSKAKKKLYELSITMEEAWELFEKQNRKCALSGLDLTFPKSREPYGGTASLDRIDSKKDYVTGNVQWVHKDINSMKNSFDQDYFISLCKLITTIY